MSETAELSHQQLLSAGAAELAACDSPRQEAEWLLAHVCQCRRETFHAWPERQVDPALALQYRALLARRAAGEPLAYLIGEQPFWGLDLQVSPAVLIPRADTEILVEQVLASHGEQAITVADLGTGSGAIALALASERPAWAVIASDSSDAALACARQNAERLGLDHIDFRHGRWCEVLSPASCDLIVSNPPYIAPNDPHLAALGHEPVSALVASDEGLADLRRIAWEALRALRPGGQLWLEHGYDQGRAVRQLLTDKGYETVHSFRDLGNNERVTCGRLPEGRAQWKTGGLCR